MPPKLLSDASAPLESLKQLMREFVAERHWEKYHTPKNLAASVSVEAAELLELFQWLTPEEAAHKPMNDPPFRQAVAEELADVLMYLVSLANVLNLDIAQTVSAKMAKNRAKYPPKNSKAITNAPYASKNAILRSS